MAVHPHLVGDLAETLSDDFAHLGLVAGSARALR